jgi:POT family proton-dependent oligopeptide transporter
MQRSRVGSGIPGALGLGEETATSISNGFYFFAALTPIPFAIVSDMWLGRYKAMVISFL